MKPREPKLASCVCFCSAASVLSRAEQQAIFLQDRQLAFKKAALQAKTNGDMELAKKYLRMAKVGRPDAAASKVLFTLDAEHLAI